MIGDVWREEFGKGKFDGWTDEWLDGWIEMDKQTDELMDGCINGRGLAILFTIFIYLLICHILVRADLCC